MSNKRTLKEHLGNQDLYVAESGPADGLWKQRMLAQFDQRHKLELGSSSTGSWIRIVSIIIPVCTLMLYLISFLKGVSPAFYIGSTLRASIWLMKAVTPWGSVVIGLVVVTSTLLVLRRSRSLPVFGF